MANALPRLLSIKETAAFLGVSVRTMYSWRSNPASSPGGTGGPPAHVLGRVLRFSEEDIAAWLAQRREDIE